MFRIWMPHALACLHIFYPRVVDGKNGQPRELVSVDSVNKCKGAYDRYRDSVREEEEDTICVW